ncbi:MAG: hypothetical protein LBM74_02450 [Oscillospiraceae bacterium]|jgi:hypothetical protein|nr:hypothetical protein [Oscillospiraceae bacterium]
MKRRIRGCLLVLLVILLSGAVGALAEGFLGDAQVYYFPDGGLSRGAIRDIGSYAYPQIPGLADVAVFTGEKNWGLAITPEGMAELLAKNPLLYDEERNMLYLTNGGNNTNIWTMSEIIFSSKVVLNQPQIDPLYMYDVTISYPKMTEMYLVGAFTEPWGPNEDVDDQGIAMISMRMPDWETVSYVPGNLRFTFPAQDDIYITCMFHMINGTFETAPSAQTHISMQDVAVGDSLTVVGKAPYWEYYEYSPYLITVTKEERLHEGSLTIMNERGIEIETPVQ